MKHREQLRKLFSSIRQYATKRLRRIHDDFKATKVCNYANRTPLRFVHMYEHCFPLSHDFLRHVHCCRSAKRKKPVQLRMCRTFDAYVMNYTP